jgi:hypothetical protein
MYGPGLQLPLISGRRRVYYGTWGLGLFQSLYEPAQGTLLSMPLMPEWYLLIGLLTLVSGLGALWPPLLVALPVLALCLLLAIAGAAKSAARPTLRIHPRSSGGRKAALLALTMMLHLLQPLARLAGRLKHGLSPWRLRGHTSVALPVARTMTAWSETWRGADQRLHAIEVALRERGSTAVRGGEFDRWDLEVRCGTLGRARARMAIEEHGQGKQLIRLRRWPRASRLAPAATGSLLVLGLACALGGTLLLAGVFAGMSLLVALRVAFESSAAAGALASSFHETCDRAPTAQSAVREQPASLRRGAESVA